MFIEKFSFLIIESKQKFNEWSKKKKNLSSSHNKKISKTWKAFFFWERELVEKFEELLNSLKEIDESLRLSGVQWWWWDGFDKKNRMCLCGARNLLNSRRMRLTLFGFADIFMNFLQPWRLCFIRKCPYWMTFSIQTRIPQKKSLQTYLIGTSSGNVRVIFFIGIKNGIREAFRLLHFFSF